MYCNGIVLIENVMVEVIAALRKSAAF